MCREYLLEQIMQIVYDEKDNNWQGRLLPIVAALNQLDPDRPDDNTCGFLAYNVPGKERMKVKTGRFLTRKLGLNSGFFNDSQISALADGVNRWLFPEVRVRLDSGEQITENYRDNVGTSSCMSGSNCGCTRLYEMNPDRFQQLVMQYNENSARAIVHKLDNGTFLLDRVYSDSEMLRDEMREYARKQGWAYRENDNAGDYDIVGAEYGDCIVSDLVYEDDCVPYMDTLTEYNINGLGLSIFHYKSGFSADGILDSQDGHIDNRQCCVNCGNSMDEDEVCSDDNGEVFCERCYSEIFISCDRCSDVICSDDAVLITDKEVYVCKYCADRHYSCCEDCDEYVSVTLSINDDKYVCEKCFENYSCCDNCGDYFSELNENDHCEDCAKDLTDEDGEEETTIISKAKQAAYSNMTGELLDENQ